MTNNTIYIAAAGSGKTTFILNQAVALHKHGLPEGKKILIVTYTDNNQSNIREKIVKKYGYIPKDILVTGWYAFLLDYWIRPFKGSVLEQLYERHIGLAFVEGISGTKKLPNGQVRTTYRNDTEKFLDKKQRNLYSDKLAEFAFKCWESNQDALIERLSNIVDIIYVDEAQDLAAWDYEVMKILFKSGKVRCILCGDPRQHTFSTTPASKNKKYEGDIVRYVEDKVNTKRRAYVGVDTVTLSKSHRCGMEICAFASSIMPTIPATEMCSCADCCSKRFAYTLQKGVFLVKVKDVHDYVNIYNPLSLIWSNATKLYVPTERQLNWGESKGLQAEATLIYLTKVLIEHYSSKRKKQNGISPLVQSKFYVAVTRAEHTVGLVVPDNFDNSIINLPFWSK